MNAAIKMTVLAATMAALTLAQAQTQTAPPGPTGAPVPASANWSQTLLDKWSGLWRNADQRGEALLASDPAAAAATFADPRRKAYAELKAGDYQRAAADLAPFADVDGLYNRGNALAHAGDLQGALKAYDGALKLDPNNRDARHNRDLVAAALKKNPPPPQKDSDKNSKDNKPGEGKSDNGGGSQSGAKDGQKDPQKDGKEGKEGSPGKEGKPGDGKDAQQNPPQGKPSDKPGQSGGKEGQGAAGSPPAQPQSKSQPQGAGQAPAQAGAGPDGGKKPGQDDKAGDAEQARRDIAAMQAGAAKPGAQQQGVPAPKTEQQIARDEWLRSIPDDPGGLLRRKFLIEHMMRQRSGQ